MGGITVGLAGAKQPRRGYGGRGSDVHCPVPHGHVRRGRKVRAPPQHWGRSVRGLPRYCVSSRSTERSLPPACPHGDGSPLPGPPSAHATTASAPVSASASATGATAAQRDLSDQNARWGLGRLRLTGEGMAWREYIRASARQQSRPFSCESGGEVPVQYENKGAEDGNPRVRAPCVLPRMRRGGRKERTTERE